MWNIKEVDPFVKGEELALLEGVTAPAVTLAVVESFGDAVRDDSHFVKSLAAVAKSLHGRYFVGAVAGETAKQW